MEVIFWTSHIEIIFLINLEHNTYMLSKENATNTSLQNKPTINMFVFFWKNEVEELNPGWLGYTSFPNQVIQAHFFNDKYLKPALRQTSALRVQGPSGKNKNHNNNFFWVWYGTSRQVK
jgi:hypothetical protein